MDTYWFLLPWNAIFRQDRIHERLENILGAVNMNRHRRRTFIIHIFVVMDHNVLSYFLANLTHLPRVNHQKLHLRLVTHHRRRRRFPNRIFHCILQGHLI